MKASYEADLASKESVLIKVTLPDGKELEGNSWRTTPYDIAKLIRFVRNIYSLIVIIKKSYS